MGFLSSLLGLPSAPHTWGNGGSSPNPYSYRGADRRDNAQFRMQGFGERALTPNFRGQGQLFQRWQQANGQSPYAPPEPPPMQQPAPYVSPEPGHFGGYRPPTNVPSPNPIGGQPLGMRPMRTPLPAKGVIRK